MKLCLEMEREGITDPGSQEGIACCLGCELTKCELESGDRRKLPGGIIYIRIQQVKQLFQYGLNIEEIAKQLGISVRTVQRYLKDGN